MKNIRKSFRQRIRAPGAKRETGKSPKEDRKYK
jgi:hypothetical protein